VLLSLQRLQSKIGSISSEEISRVIEMTIAGVKKIEGFSKNLLSRARIASRLAPTDLNKVIADFVDFMKILARFKLNTMVIILDEKVPTMNLDIDQMQQVLLNLMNNIVEARKDAKIEMRTQYNTGLNEVRLTVRDNGPGIEESILPKLFVERVTNKPEGHGYGLSVCRQIIENHGGSIRVESKKDEGATFTVTLPVARTT
jgi:two-component system sporulation sensor kinase A